MPPTHNIERGNYRLGTRTTATPDPRKFERDISEKIRMHDPMGTGLLEIWDLFKKGPKPKSMKIEVQKGQMFDHYDSFTPVEFFNGADARYARVTPLNGVQLYQPRDKFYIVRTGQQVEVVMTPVASYHFSNDQYLSLPTAITGNTATSTAEGTMVVRVIDPVPVKRFDRSDVVVMGNALYESEPVRTEGFQFDYTYDANFVELKEATLTFTREQKEIMQTTGKVPDWNEHQKQMLTKFKRDVGFNMMFSERGVDASNPGRLKRNMRGLIPSIETNVSVYNPDAIMDFEKFITDFIVFQAFRYNPNGNSKVILCGTRFMHRVAQALSPYRRITGIESRNITPPGLNFEKYDYMGFVLNFKRTDMFRIGSDLQDWAVVIDPTEIETRCVREWTTREVSLPTEREYKIMVEWEGSMAFHNEATCALIRTP